MVKSIKSYTEEYMKDYGFEAEMVRYRRELLLERLTHYAPRTVIELGCGSDLQAAGYQARGGTWDKWTVVEPSKVFADCAHQSGLPNMTVIQGFFENVGSEIQSDPDLLLCSGLLHEVPNADRLIEAMRAKMGSETILHINVPNARSIHRQLAQAMGLIENLTSISPRNAALQQPRVFDMESLVAQLARHSLKLVQSGGYLMKPFTHQQMAPLVKNLGRDVMNGLFVFGKNNPETASEIYVEVTL